MARVLAYTSPARGHLYPLVPILDELHARGHRIAVRTLPSELAALRERGFTADPIAEPILAIEHDDWQARTQLAALRRSLATFARRAEHEPGDLHAALEAERPDLLLVDTTTWGAAAVAEARGGPWAQWLPFPAPLPSRDAPPFGPGFAPASGPLGRVRDRVLGPVLLAWLRPCAPAGGQRRACGGRARAAARGGRDLHARRRDALHERRAVRVPALGLAGDVPADRPDHVGPARRDAGLARGARRPARPRQHLVGVPGRRPARRHRARGAARRRRVGRRDDAVAPTPAAIDVPAERPRRALRPARAAARARGLRRLPRRDGDHPEGARGRRPGLRRAVRPRPARGGAPGRGRRRRDAAAGPPSRCQRACGRRWRPRWRWAAARGASQAGFAAAGGARAAADELEPLIRAPPRSAPAGLVEPRS